MKRAIAFAVVLIAALGGLYYSQKRAKEDDVTSNAVMHIAADVQRDMGRAPLHFTRMADEEEIRIGDALAANILASRPELDAENEAAEKYIQRIGGTLASRAHRKLPYRFHLDPNPNLINAFALPGGHVFVGKGMFDRAGTDDELANVIGHEIEHIDHYHCAERYQMEAKLGHLRLGIIADLMNLPIGLWQTGYQKEEELEADEEGMRLAAQAGFSPFGAVTLFEKFEALEQRYLRKANNPAEEVSELALQSLEGYFRSHPAPSERLEGARAVIAENHWEDRARQTPIHLSYEVHNGKPAE